jgi:Na+-driven multidrug efflux pump
MIILAVPFIRGQVQSSLSPRYFRFSWKTMGDIVYVGFPSLMRQGLNAVSTMILNSCAGVYGDAAVAAISIVNRIMMFMLCVTIGIGQGFQPVSAFNYGAGKYSRVKEGFVFSLKLPTVLMVIAAAAGCIWAPELVTIFRDDPEVIEIGTTAMQIRCISLVFLPMSVKTCFSNRNMLFQSIGKGGTATFLAALRSGIILIPLVIILSALFGLGGLEVSQGISELIASIISTPFCVAFLQRLPADIPG